jgi:hypothetical protein
VGRRADHLAGALVVTPTRTWLVGAAVAAAALGVVLALVLSGGSTTPAPEAAVSAQASLSRSAALFADQLQASIQVLVDTRRVDPTRVGFNTSFRPFARVGIPRVSRHDAGRLARLVFTTDLVCSTNDCLAKTGRARIQFPRAQVFYYPRDGSARHTVELAWQPIILAGRTSNADVANGDPFQQPAWRASSDPLPVTYSASPVALKTGLFVVSGLLFVVAAFALWRLLGALQGRIRVPLPTALERAVRLVERTESHDDAAAKRKALELLSRELARSGESQLALVARELAWAEPTPLPAVTQPLTLDVRRLIEQRSNGHAG